MVVGWGAFLGAIIFAIGVIYAAGKIVQGTRNEATQTKVDVNRLGYKMHDEEKAAARRHFNICLIMVAAEPDPDKRFRIAGQLKED